MQFRRLFRIRPQIVQLYDVPESDSTADSYGQRSLAPTLLGEFPATVLPLKGQEQLNVRAIWPAATHTVWMPWLGSAISSTQSNPYGLILPRMYVVLVQEDMSQLNIIYAENFEKRNAHWKLTCEQKVVT